MVPEIFQDLTNLEEIDISENPLTSIPNLNGCSQSLKKLSLRETNLQSFPLEVLDCVQLEELNLVDTKLTSIPIGISRLAKLKSLTLNSNSFKTLPNELFDLKNLEYLGLSSCGLERITESITRLSCSTSFKKLDLTGNNIPKIVKDKGYWGKLELFQAFGDRIYL